MLSELETLTENVIAALSRKALDDYPQLNLYRHHMQLTVQPTDQLHALFDRLDWDNAALKDLLLCCGAEVVTLDTHLLGLRLNAFDQTLPTAVYWIKCNTQLSELPMSAFYDTVHTFVESIPEEQRAYQRIQFGECSQLVTWNSILNHIVNDPRAAVFGCLNHRHRFFTPSADLYVRAKNRQDKPVYPTSDLLTPDDLAADNAVWFMVRGDVRTTVAL